MADVNLITKETLNITCMKGDTFKLEMVWRDSQSDLMDLTAYTFKSEVRIPNVAGGVVITFENSDFSKDASGNLVMTKSATDMGINASSYVYDVQATKTSTGEVFTWLGGLFIVKDDVTE